MMVGLLWCNNFARAIDSKGVSTDVEWQLWLGGNQGGKGGRYSPNIRVRVTDFIVE